MRYSVSDFIDSDTLRSHLQKKTLEPAIECILIAQSEAQPLQKKLEALQERYDAYSNGQFAEGIYHVGGIDCEMDETPFKERIRLFIAAMRTALRQIEQPADYGKIYMVLDENDGSPDGIFDSFNQAAAYCGELEYETARIIRFAVNDPDGPGAVYQLNDQQEISIIRISADFYPYDLPFAYAEIPHEYRAGDIITSRRNGDH